MVGHDLHLGDLEPELAGDFPRDLLEALVDSVHEDGPTVLRAEDHMVVAGENYVAVTGGMREQTVSMLRMGLRKP